MPWLSMKNKEKSVRRLSRASLATLIAVYFLILVGGIVRSTGSGMGCPDWPKCFGQWVPPTSVSQLPLDYKEKYSDKRHQKNIRFAKYLKVLGFDETANELLADESIKEEADFNVTKTWTEYINRLIGVCIGLFVILTFLCAIPFLKTNKTIFFVALTALILVVFQGWLGSIVVSTNLLPWMVTIHMFVALIIVALLIYLVFITHHNWRFSKNTGQTIPWFVMFCIICTLVQIALGTQVREGIDIIAASLDYTQRSSWVDQLGSTFLIHRSFSWIIVAAHVWIAYRLFKMKVNSRALGALLIIILLSIFTGVTLNYLGFPASVQPVHLLLGTMAFGFQFFLFLQLNYSKRTIAA